LNAWQLHLKNTISCKEICFDFIL